MDLKIRVVAERVNGNWKMRFLGGEGEERFRIPKTMLGDFNSMRSEFEPVLDQPGVKEQVEARINSIIEKHCGKDGKYIWVPGWGFMNRGKQDDV